MIYGVSTSEREVQGTNATTTTTTKREVLVLYHILENGTTKHKTGLAESDAEQTTTPAMVDTKNMTATAEETTSEYYYYY